MSEVETVEVDAGLLGRLAPLEYVGRIERDGALFLRGIDGMELKVGDVIVVRSSAESWHPLRAGRAVVVRGLGITFDGIPAVAEGDYVYRIGKPLTPSIEERLVALERAVGLAAADYEVARDAQMSGRPDAAETIRADVRARAESARLNAATIGEQVEAAEPVDWSGVDGVSR